MFRRVFRFLKRRADELRGKEEKYELTKEEKDFIELDQKANKNN